MKLDKQYNIDIASDSFFITEQKQNKGIKRYKQDLSILTKIETILSQGLTYSSEHKDAFSELDPKQLEEQLWNIAVKVKADVDVNYSKSKLFNKSKLKKIKKDVELVYNRMVRANFESTHLLQRPTKGGSLEGIPPEVALLITQNLGAKDLINFSATTKQAHTLTDSALVKKAKNVGFKGTSVKEAKQYLKELTEEIQLLEKSISNSKARLLKGVKRQDLIEIVSDRLTYCNAEDFMYLIDKAIKLKCTKFYHLFPTDFSFKINETNPTSFPNKIFKIKSKVITKPTEMMTRVFSRGFLEKNTHILGIILKNFSREGISFYNPNNPIQVNPIKFQRQGPYNSKIGLLHAALDRNIGLETFKLLLENGFDIQEKEEKWSSSLLQKAIQLERTSNVKFLLEAGLDVNFFIPLKSSSPIHMAANVKNKELVEILLQHKADVNLANWNHRYPILAAITSDNPEIVDLFIEAGSNLYRGSKEDFPLHYAVKGNGDPPKANLNILKILLEAHIKQNIDINLRNSDGKTALDIAIENNQIEVVKILLENGAQISNSSARITPLHWAVKNENLAMVKLLLEYKEVKDSINYRDQAGETPLFKASYDNSLEMMKLLVEMGADVNIQDKSGITALHNAAFNGDLEKLQFLLENGAIVDIFTHRKSITALAAACGRGGIYKNRRKFIKKEIVEALIQRGADTKIKVEGYDLKYWLSRQGDIRKDKELKEIYEML